MNAVRQVVTRIWHSVRSDPDRVVFVLLTCMLLLSSNTVWGSEFRDGLFAKVGMLSSIVICGCIAAHAFALDKLSVREVSVWLVFVGAFGLAYVAIWLHSMDPGSNVQLVSFIIMCFTALAWVALNRQGKVEKFLYAIVDVVTFLAATSLVLWLLGPILEILHPNIRMNLSWAPGDGTGTSIRGYFHLLYYTQSDVFFGKTIARNSGIFVESPLFAFVLVVALLIEVLLLKRRSRTKVVVLLTVAILSTLSITAYLVLGVLAGIVVIPLIFQYFTNPRNERKKKIILAAVLIAFGLLFGYVFVRKIFSASWAIRMDDYVAGFKAWCKSPLLGNGLSSDQVIINRMSGFRINNTGMSNSITQVLAFGGVALLAVYLCGILGFFIRRRPQSVRFGVTYFVLWSVTVVTFFTFSMAIIGIGLGEMVLRSSKYGRRHAKKDKNETKHKIPSNHYAIYGVAAVCAGAIVMGFVGYMVARQTFVTLYDAKATVEVRDTKRHKVVSDAFGLDHVAYLLGSQRVHLIVSAKMPQQDSDELIVSTDVVPKAVEVHCSSPDVDASVAYVDEAVRAANNLSWMVQHKYSLALRDTSWTEIMPNRSQCALATTFVGVILGFGIMLLHYDSLLMRARRR